MSYEDQICCACGEYLTADDVELGYTMCQDCREEEIRRKEQQRREDRILRQLEEER
jgi:predicted RNA-binding Zn-ribbon protein involved in translation (DUF1610 family)